MRPRNAWWLMMAGSLLLARPALAGSVCGTVRVPAGSSELHLHPYPGRAGSMPTHGRPASGPQDAVVWVESLDARVDSLLPRPKIARLAQQGQAFMPRVVAVPRGGTVEFPNMDPIFHNVFSLSPVRRFDLGKYPRGQSRRVTFPKAGVVGVFCDIHSDMSGFVVVVPNRAFTRPDESGRYCLPTLPRGRYQVHVWHPDHPEQRHVVDVTGDGEVSLTAGW